LQVSYSTKKNKPIPKKYTPEQYQIIALYHMQNQFYNTTIQQQIFNPQIDRPQGCYQISPFGVVLQPISERPHPSQNPPMTTNKAGIEHPSISLTPLSNGFIYQPTYLPQSPPQPPPIVVPSNTPSPQFSTNAPQFVSQEIAARQEKLEKYREKRARRNFNRQVDQGKRERACARTRDLHGHFAIESARQEKMRQALEASKRESMMLKSKLSNIEQEMAALRQKAEEASASKQHIQQQLEAQQEINQVLLLQNSLLWSTVPSDEVFNTISTTNPPGFLDAFKQKIDFSTIELNWTDSPHLEAARVEDTEFEHRWDEMNSDCFFAGARS
jgi:hypothetical protein